jgi:molybdopterin synthase catalytic subunit
MSEGGAAAGGPAARVLLARVTLEPLSIARAADLVHAASAGAVVTFEGVVRDHDDGRGVTALEYEGHPTATSVLREVALDVAARHPGVTIAVEHRTGALVVGDIALAAAVSSAHRADAFEACARLVDEVKARVPIWKKQDFADGSSEWVASLG